MLGDEMRRLRKRLNMSQKGLAEAMDVAQSTIASWENGSRKPDIGTLTRLAEFLGVTNDELLGIQPPNEISDEERELWEVREAARKDPERRLLFKLAKNGSARDVKQAVAIIDALRATNPDFYSGDDDE